MSRVKACICSGSGMTANVSFDFEAFLKKFYEPGSEFISHLLCLWEALAEDIFKYNEAPYPVSHGSVHISHVLLHLADLLVPYQKTKLFSDRDLYFLFAAALYHDAGMIYLINKGSYGSSSKKVRHEHSSMGAITRAIETTLQRCGTDTYKEEIPLTIAWGHADDDQFSAEDKLTILAKYTTRLQYGHLLVFTCLLRLADFLDIHIARLIRPYRTLHWDGDQLSHINKHELIKTEIDPPLITIRDIITSKAPQEICYAILRSVHDEATVILNDLNRYSSTKWLLSELDESRFGKIYPLSLGVQLFNYVFRESLKRKHGKLSLDMMGHSLYGRFVEDKENINSELLRHLENGELAIRILLLDPLIENQQMQEVLEAQKAEQLSSSKGAIDLKRYIMPQFDKTGNPIAGTGDICATLEKIDSEWRASFGPGSLLEVRVTTRLMYASIARFGELLIVTPYSRGGLFDRSFALLLQRESPLYKKYCDEFESIWNNPLETRLWLLKGASPRKENPISRLLPSKNLTIRVSPFDYERTLLTSHWQRIVAVFEKVLSAHKSAPFVRPFEVEFQPSEECDLNCGHCIGRSIKKWRRQIPDNCRTMGIDTLFETSDSKFTLRTIRVSGLLGDPLGSRTAEQFTYDLIGKAKQHEKKTVLITNGQKLGNMIKHNLFAALDYLHISVDAPDEETYKMLKNPRTPGFFNRLVHQIRTIPKSACKIGLGYVITNENISGVRQFIRLACELNVDFVRFKPDIRLSSKMNLLSWSELEKVIASSQQMNGPEIHLTMLPMPRHWHHPTERCWAQYFCSTVRKDGKVYPCDHLTLNGEEGQLGDLTLLPFDQIIENAYASGRLGKVYSTCEVCPPYNWRINRFLDQLFIIFRDHPTDTVKWIKDLIEE